MAAPTPMSWLRWLWRSTTATKVTTPSGRAVPRAASRVPTAMRLTLSSTPSHSTAFKNHSQAR